MNEQVKSIDVEEVNILAAPRKTRKHISIGKRIAAGLGVAAIVCSMALPVFAADPETSESSTTINTVMSNSFDGLKDDLIGTANAVMLPALGVFGVTFCVKKGKKIFRTMSN